MPVKQREKSAVGTASVTHPDVIGVYEGEAMDCNITNLNGLDITKEVMELVFASDEYKQGIENGWYIGFLGHPEDPNCMDFQNGCIVMREGHLDENGKVFGRFDLVDTPVGRTVSIFQNAGVKFGISIRGAGEVTQNSVDPESFVFRGFDLVSFPAYPGSVPTFSAIAASSRPDDRAKYKAVCAAVSADAHLITSPATLDVLKEQFAPQSKEYKLLSDCKARLESNEADDGRIPESDETGTTGSVDISGQKIAAVTDLYLDALKANHELAAENEALRRNVHSVKVSASRRISIIGKNHRRMVEDALKDVQVIKAAHDKLDQDKRKIERDLQKISETNLIYCRRATSDKQEIQRLTSVTASLKSQLDDTFRQQTSEHRRTANLDSKAKENSASIQACRSQIRAYQIAYASMLEDAMGVQIDHSKITAATTVDDLKRMVTSATNTTNMSADMTMPAVLDLYMDDVDEDNLDEIVSV